MPGSVINSTSAVDVIIHAVSAPLIDSCGTSDGFVSVGAGADAAATAGAVAGTAADAAAAGRAAKPGIDPAAAAAIAASGGTVTLADASCAACAGCACASPARRWQAAPRSAMRRG